jgi:uncharacterized membrane protein
MGTNRLEAFSASVMAILITIMVLELKVPHGATIEALLPLWPVFLSYVLSFIYIGIYWHKLQWGNRPSFSLIATSAIDRVYSCRKFLSCLKM